MPYIDKNKRHNIELLFGIDSLIFDPGELNYLITRFVDEFVKRKGEKYSVFNEVVGVLECCKLEYYRRMVAPYEEKKKKQNGDVYGQ